MKKILVILLAIAAFSSSIECKKKKMNRFNEFLKGSIAAGTAAGLAYLAYEGDPLDKLNTQLAKLKSIFSQETLKTIDRTLKGSRKFDLNSLNPFAKKSSLSQLDNNKILSFGFVILSYELAKYALDKLGNSVRSNKDNSSLEEND